MDILSMIFCNKNLGQELELEMSQILLQFLEENQHLFSPRVLNAVKLLKIEILKLEADKGYLKEAS